LIYLDLAENKITDIFPLAVLTRLQVLNLYANNPASFDPLRKLTLLVDLSISNIDYALVPDLQKHLPKCVIVLDGFIIAPPQSY
jgi:Leucine-rich repeat (LRR) protein